MTVYQQDYDYQPAADRYRLVVSEACPFAQRTMIARELLGLDEVISLGVTSPVKTERIWDFSLDPEGVDPVLDVAYVEHLYHMTDPTYDGPYSVPILVYVDSRQVVNQESLDIVYDFAHRFKEWHAADAPELYPAALQEEIDQWIGRIATDVMGAGNQAGFATKQTKYQRLVDIFFDCLDDIDDLLADGRTYLLGDQLTVADIVLYTPLVRLDIGYYPAYGVNKKHLTDYDHLWPYMHRLYQIPAFKNSTDFEAMKSGIYLGKNAKQLFQREVLPVGPDTSHWN